MRNIVLLSVVAAACDTGDPGVDDFVPCAAEWSADFGTPEANNWTGLCDKRCQVRPHTAPDAVCPVTVYISENGAPAEHKAFNCDSFEVGGVYVRHAGDDGCCTLDAPSGEWAVYWHGCE